MTNDEEGNEGNGNGNEIDPLAPPPPMTPSGGGNGGNAGITQQVPPPPPPLTPSGGGNGGNVGQQLPPPPPPPPPPTPIGGGRQNNVGAQVVNATLPRPVHGAYVQYLSSNGYVTYIPATPGGEPNPTWTGLVSPPAVITNPNHHRGNSERSSISFNKRREAVPGMPFKRGDDLQVFTDTVLDHFETHGLTTVLYRPNPIDASKMISVLLCWQRLNLPSIRAESIVCKPKWDDYDSENDKSAISSLLLSLAPEYRSTIRRFQRPSDTAADVWMLIVSKEQPPSATKFETLVNTIKTTKASDFVNENIEEMVLKIKKPLNDLQVAEAYDEATTITVAKNLIEAGSDGVNDNWEFNQELKEMYNQLKAVIPTLTHLPNAEKTKRLMALGISITDFLHKAEELYSLQMAPDNITWPPACHAKDSKAVPRNMAQLATSKRMSDNNGTTEEDADGNKTFSLLRIPPPDDAPSTGSKDGYPVYEQKVYGITLYWCNKCHLWTNSHSTGRHINNYKRNKGKKEKDGTTTDPTSNYASGITFDPSVWFCEISEPHRHQEELRAPITITDL